MLIKTTPKQILNSGIFFFLMDEYFLSPGDRSMKLTQHLCPMGLIGTYMVPW